MEAVLAKLGGSTHNIYHQYTHMFSAVKQLAGLTPARKDHGLLSSSWHPGAEHLQPDVFWPPGPAIRQCHGRQALLQLSQTGGTIAKAALVVVHDDANLHCYTIDYDPEEFELLNAWESPKGTWVALLLHDKSSDECDLRVMYIGENLVSNLHMCYKFQARQFVSSEWISDSAFAAGNSKFRSTRQFVFFLTSTCGV